MIAAASTACSSDSDSSDDAETTDEATEETIQTAGDPVEVDGARLTCEGEAAVPVILLAGGDDPSSIWDAVVDGLGDDTLTCTFDRPGVATDEPPAEPLTPGGVSDTLVTALDESGLEGPYVFVGHSLGGVVLRTLGQEHPDLVAGAVFVDPTTPVALAALAPDLAAAGWDAEGAQADMAVETPWPDVPLVVLSRDPALGSFGNATIEDLWVEGQLAYAALTPGGTQQAVTGAGHYVHIDEPAAVVGAIDAVLAEVEPGE